ncbi:TonB-dependent receptor [Sphingomonas sp.]|uniref:TonB-dependent receptor n=1 Tax=Sphingomonas sp. TaxID=28214 RepID=UPI003AFFE1BC
MVRTAQILAGCSVLALAAVPAGAQNMVTPSAPGDSRNDASAPAPAVTAQSNEIIVTATKRRERIDQVPLAISAVTGDQLQRANANSLSDYINRLPGVVFNDYQPGVSEVVIRGISATTYHEQGQTTVGYYLNDVQIVEPGFPLGIPDIDTFDIDRVEVLRGPQGTLFGSSTLGGLVNYIAKTADPTRFDLAAEGLIGSTHNANGQLNYAGKAMVNIPIVADKLAVRVMALQRFDAGYIDNVGLTPAKQATNDFRTRGIRGSVVFTPTNDTKITYLGTYQDTKLDDETYITTGGTYVRSTGIREPQQTRFFLNSLRLDQTFQDFATLTVLGSIDHKRNRTTFADPYGYVTSTFGGPDVPFDKTRAHANIKTIEARLASADTGGPFRWLIGTSYLRSRQVSLDQLYDPGAEAFINNAEPGVFPYPASVLAPGDRVYSYFTSTRNTDFGVFGEATLRLMPGIEITGGGRYFRTEAKGDVVNGAGFVSGSPVDLAGSVDQKEHGFTPKATLSVKPNSHLLAYFTYSQGYRVGGINPNAGLLPAIPTAYGSDKVYNYEFGVKASTPDNRVTVDATVFNMDWKNIQAREFGPAPSFYSYVLNAADANVAGVEVALTVRPLRNLTISSNMTYQDAHLTKPLPDNYGPGYPAGTTLPGSSNWSVANNVEYELPGVSGKPSVELAHRYLSTAPVAFGNPNTRGGFNVFDARAGVTVREHFRLLGFVNNMFNKYGILNAPFTAQTAPAYSIIRPRTYGLRIDWTL